MSNDRKRALAGPDNIFYSEVVRVVERSKE